MDAPPSATDDTPAADPSVSGGGHDDTGDGLLTVLQRAAIRSRMFATPLSVVVGRYVVLEHLGSGGMGDVFVAYDPNLDRKVALKVVRSREADDEEARARMLREAQAMARLTHPNVVVVHDSGVERGLVFVAMELVDGVTLRKWLESAPRWPRALELLLGAARGVVAAHAAGILHRDLKPDNIMVGHDGRARVMDFGLARTQPTTLEDTHRGVQGDTDARALELTRTGALLGTPAYMSPEQLEAGPVDARSDQFSFCVVLWESVHGERPFVGDSLPALAAAIHRGRPRLPERDRGVPRWLTAVLERGLAVDPERRFPSMAELIDALEAGRGRSRRRRFAAVGAGVVAVALGGIGLRELGRRHAIAACDDDGAAIAEVWNDAASERLREAVVATGSVHASEAHARAVPWIEEWSARWSTARREACIAGTVDGTMAGEQYARARACFDGRRDELAAALDVFMASDREVVARLVPAFANLTGPEPCGDSVVLARRSARGLGDAELRRELSRADGSAMAGRYAQASAGARSVADAAESAGDRELAAQALASAGRHAQDAGDVDEAEVALRRALELAGPLGLDDVAADAATELAYVVGVDREHHDAGLAWADAAAVFVATLGEEEQMRGATLAGQTGAIHFRRGDWAAAIEAQERALAIKERILGDAHPAVATSLLNLANAVSARGEKARARGLYEQALAIFEESLGPDHPNVATCANNLGATATDLGDYAAARGHLERALAIREASFGAGHVSTASTLNNLANVQLELGELDAALSSFERSLEIRRATSGPDHPDVALALANLAKVERRMGRLQDAKAHQEEALAIRERALAPDHPDLVDSLNALAFVCFALGELDRADELYTRAAAIAEKANGADHPEVASALLGLADVARQRGRHDEALALFERVVAIRDRAEVQPVDRGVARFGLARALRSSGKDPERARELATRARVEFLTVGDAQQERIDAIDAFLADPPR